MVLLPSNSLVSCTGPELRLPAHFHPIFFPIGNFATGFFVVFALLAGVVGAASCIVGFTHLRFWSYHSQEPAASLGLIAWALTVLAMGYAPDRTSSLSPVANQSFRSDTNGESLSLQAGLSGDLF
jgi:hypothetical protein